MNEHRLLLYAFLASVALICILALYTVAFGAIPEFPFKNTQQFGPGIPGWTPTGPPDVGHCKGIRVFMFQYKAETGNAGWQIWVRMEGTDWTAAYFVDVTEDGAKPVAVYFGTSNDANGHITLTSSAPFDPTKHTAPCQDWK